MPVPLLPQLADVLAVGEPFFAPRSVETLEERLALSLIANCFDATVAECGMRPTLLFASEDVLAALYGKSVDELREQEQQRREQLDFEDTEALDLFVSSVREIFGIEVSPTAGLLFFRGARIVPTADLGKCHCAFITPQ